MKSNTLVIFLALITAGCTAENPRQLVRDAGYLTTIPPSTSYGPGSVVWKKNNQKRMDKKDVSLGYICSPDYVKMPGPPEKGYGGSASLGRNKKFSLTSDNLKALGFSASAKHVRNLTIKFSNIEYLEYGLDKLETITSSLNAGCRNILRKQKAKKNAYIVRSAFKADLHYEITYHSSADAAAKLQIHRELEANIGLKITGDEGQQGRGLYYGVETDPLF